MFEESMLQLNNKVFVSPPTTTSLYSVILLMEQQSLLTAPDNVDNVGHNNSDDQTTVEPDLC